MSILRIEKAADGGGYAVYGPGEGAGSLLAVATSGEHLGRIVSRWAAGPRGPSAADSLAAPFIGQETGEVTLKARIGGAVTFTVALPSHRMNLHCQDVPAEMGTPGEGYIVHVDSGREGLFISWHTALGAPGRLSVSAWDILEGEIE